MPGTELKVDLGDRVTVQHNCNVELRMHCLLAIGSLALECSAPIRCRVTELESVLMLV